MSQTAASLVRSVHLASIAFILFGWVLPKEFLSGHLLFLPIVMFHWWTNKGQCVLTQMEHKLRGQPTGKVQGEFVKDLFQKIGFRPSKTLMMFIIYGAMFISGLISAFRLGILT